MSKSLSELYSCSLHSKNPDTGFEEYDKLVDQIHKDLKNSKVEREEDISYAEGTNTKVDIWGPTTNEKLFIMIHGGYWLFGSRKKCLAVFDVANKHGYTVATIGYDFVGEKQTLSQTIDQVLQGVTFALSRCSSAKTVIIAGHSVGAHLAFKVLTSIKDPRVKGGMLIAGIYQLEELVQTDYGKQLYLTTEEAKKCSCNYTDLNSLNIPILATCCDFESPKLLEQDLLLAEAVPTLTSKRYSTEDHYSILTELRNPSSSVHSDFSTFLSQF